MNILKELHEAFTTLEKLQRYRPPEPDTVPPVRQWKKNTAYGGWWGYTEYADGKTLHGFRFYPQIATDTSIAKRENYIEFRDELENTLRKQISELVSIGELPSCVVGLFRNYSYERIGDIMKNGYEGRKQYVCDAIEHLKHVMKYQTEAVL